MLPFGTAQAVKGAFKADLAKVLLNGQASGLILQSINFTYAQSVNVLYQLSSTDIYYIVGRATGNAGIARVVGPTEANTAFLVKFGDGCQAPTNQLEIRSEAGCNTNNSGVTSASYTLAGCLITTLSGNIAVPDMLVNEQLQMVFANLDKK